MTDGKIAMPGLARNPLSIAGAVVVTLAAMLFLGFFLMDLFGLHSNPYLGIVFFLIVPGIFLFGLLLIPLGMLLERNRQARGLRPRAWPRLDLNVPSHRRTVLAVAALTLVNVVIVSLAAYRGVEYMDSPGFCGQVCHEVMEPEWTAYEDGPHSRVACVQCHIGPGAPWFVRSKMSGTRQVFAVLLNTYSRPIASPVHNLRPARDTCEQCHWPEKFHGDIVNVRREYGDDEAVTETAMTMRVHVGGASATTGLAQGIHWHTSSANEIDYIATDDRRQVISYVRLRTADGQVREYFDPGVTQEQLEQGERRRMDCVDCHNRPSHPFSASPERAVDASIAAGEIPRTIPYVRREAVEALKVSYPSREVAEAEIANRLTGFYANNGNADGGSRADLDQAIAATQRLYRRNVFPRMRVTWGTHPNNAGHMDFPGCFRCHDDTKKTADGRTISQDCSLCHEIE